MPFRNRKPAADTDSDDGCPENDMSDDGTRKLPCFAAGMVIMVLSMTFHAAYSPPSHVLEQNKSFDCSVGVGLLPMSEWRDDRKLWCCSYKHVCAREPGLPPLSDTLEASDLGPNHTYHPSTVGSPTVTTCAGLECLWEAPDLAGQVEQSEKRRARGVLFLAHGCSHQATDWWGPSTRCPRCLGLPEERHIVAAGLHRGLAVLAMSSSDRVTRCWSEADIPLVQAGLKEIAKQNAWQGLPLYLLGASSGGSFVAHLGSVLGDAVAAVNAQIAPGGGLPQAGERFVPTVVTHMPRDKKTARADRLGLAQLRKHGTPSHAVREQLALPVALDPLFFSRRCLEVTPDQSRAIFSALQTALLFDGAGRLQADPRGSGWRHALRQHAAAAIGGVNLQPDESCVSEEMNVAWASHEIWGSGVRETLDFFEEWGARWAAKGKQTPWW